MFGSGVAGGVMDMRAELEELMFPGTYEKKGFRPTAKFKQSYFRLCKDHIETRSDNTDGRT